jgi:hypothetical protein
MANIVATGTGTFNRGPRHDVVFKTKIPLPYAVFLSPDAGYEGRSIAPLAVVEKLVTGFVVRSSDGNSRATYDWMVVV